ncbi:hypothetical protein NFI96_006847 [Prochilodus magdalenae]|nr:hypothetical protein NFI96_006847 [Prochilodus magdalenae]
MYSSDQKSLKNISTVSSFREKQTQPEAESLQQNPPKKPRCSQRAVRSPDNRVADRTSSIDCQTPGHVTRGRTTRGTTRGREEKLHADPLPGEDGRPSQGPASSTNPNAWVNGGPPPRPDQPARRGFKEERLSSPEINQGRTFELGPRDRQRGVTELTPLNSWNLPNPIEQVSLPSRHHPFPHVQPPGPSDRELDKIARNIIRFEPRPEGSNDVIAYLKDIDYYLRRFPHVTIDHKIYLIKVTSNRDVSSFIERQTDYVRSHYDALCQALVEEFSEYTEQTGLIAASTVKQLSQESPQLYYKRLFHTYFGARNEPGMEEDLHFKTLFVENLHPSTSYHLGVAACPRTLSSKQLRDLALKGFAKHQQALSNPAIPHSTPGCDTRSLHSYPSHNRAQQLRSDETQNHSGRYTDPLCSEHHRNQFSGIQRESVRDNQHPNQTIHPFTKTPPSLSQYDSTGLATIKNQHMRKRKKADANPNPDEPEQLFQTLNSPAKRVNETANQTQPEAESLQQNPPKKPRCSQRAVRSPDNRVADRTSSIDCQTPGHVTRGRTTRGTTRGREEKLHADPLPGEDGRPSQGPASSTNPNAWVNGGPPPDQTSLHDAVSSKKPACVLACDPTHCSFPITPQVARYETNWQANKGASEMEKTFKYRLVYFALSSRLYLSDFLIKNSQDGKRITNSTIVAQKDSAAIPEWCYPA